MTQSTGSMLGEITIDLSSADSSFATAMLRSLIRSRSDLRFDRSTLLQQPSNQPAEDRPGHAGRPSGQDIGRIMNAQINAAQSHECRQRQCHKQEVRLELSLLNEPAQQCAQREEHGCREHGVAAGKRTGIDGTKVGNGTGPRSIERPLKERADNQSPKRGDNHERGSAIHLTKPQEAHDRSRQERQKCDTS
jgi:hypothetical protein